MMVEVWSILWSWILVKVFMLNLDQLVIWLKSSYFGESTQLLGPLCLCQYFCILCNSVFWPRPRWTYFCILRIFVFWPRPRWIWRRAWSRGRGWRRGGKGSEWVSTSFLGKNFCKQEINSFLLVSYQKMPTEMQNEKNWALSAYFLGEKVLEERVQIICWRNQVIHWGGKAEG